MKKLRRSVFLFLLFCAMFFLSVPAAHADATSTIIDSDITVNTVWTADQSPYVVSSSVNIATSVTLTISPGVVVLFDYGASLNVSGSLVADGVSGNKIYFSSIDDGTINGQVPDASDTDIVIPPTVGDYDGIVFSASSTGEFQNIEMRYSLDGINANKSALSISDSTFTNNYSGILTRFGALHLVNNIFSNNDTPLEVSMRTQFAHNGNTFLNNANNVIMMYDSLQKVDYDFSFDSVPYSLVDTIAVSSGCTLTIDPGVTLLNGSTGDMQIGINNGTLNAIGAPDNRITFDGISFKLQGSSAALTLKNADIKNLTNENDTAVFGFEGLVTFDGVNISNVSSGLFFSRGTGVDADIENTNISINNDSDFGQGIFASDNSFVLLHNVLIQKTASDGEYYGILARVGSFVDADAVAIDGFNEGVIIYDGSNMNATKLIIKNSTNAGVVEFNESDGSTSTSLYPNNSVQLRESELMGGVYGIYDYGNTDNDISNSSIHNNTSSGVFVSVPDDNPSEIAQGTGLLNFTNNWWGDISGPYNEAMNSSGLGNAVSDGVNFKPWTRHDPSLPQPTPVLIVPGVLGTEISKQNSDGSLEKLWLDLGHNFTDLNDGFMDPLEFNDDLSPTDNSLVLGDVLRDMIVNIKIDTFAIYDYTGSLLKEFQKQGYVENSDLFVFPYDWRYGVSDTTVNQLKQKISDILTETGSDKIDIVAHSTGGLLVKKYVMQNPTTNNIDKAVFVGVPNTGAPKAIKTLLEGDNFDNLFLSDGEMQKIARNLPVVYDLAPTAEYYKNNGSVVRTVNDHFFDSVATDLNFSDMTDFLINKHGFNAQAWSNAQSLHTSDFDNFDMRTAGVDVYAIDGCKTGTIGKVVEVNSMFPTYDALIETPGDGTVPFESATNLPINENNKYYALKAEHGSMLSQDGIRQQIVNIITASSTPISNTLITQDINQCGLNGRAISIYSPLSIDITDQDGNHSGISSDGMSIENNIPNADYEIMGDHKYVYLPTDNGQNYTIKVAGTGSGLFTLTDATIANNQTTGMQVFSQIPVTTALVGTLHLGNVTTLTLDTNGDGVTDTTLQPNASLDSIDAQNFDQIQFANKNSANLVSDVPIRTPIIYGQAGHVAVVTQVSTVTSTTSDVVKKESIDSIKPVSKNIAIGYNNIETKHVIQNVAKPESKIGSTDTTLAAMSEGSTVPISRNNILEGLVGLAGLAFISRKFIK